LQDIREEIRVRISWSADEIRFTNMEVTMADILRHVTKSEDFNEQRKTARLDVPIKVQYRILDERRATNDERRKEAVTKDISAGGCLLLVAEELPANSEVELQIFLGESQTESLTLKGKIARLNRAEKDLYEYGIAFDSISREARRLFADYFFAKMYEMIGLSEWPTDRKAKK
jgi:c-di-GMP-binding flagellar brake protein YcgR